MNGNQIVEVHFEYLGEGQDYGGKIWKVEAIHVTTTRNKRMFTQTELEAAGRSLSFRPLNINKDKKKIILLSVGGLYKIKGHHLIIKALKILVNKGYNAKLLIVGGGYYKRYLSNLTKRLNLQDRVEFLGKKNHKELAKIYNIADIFVLANYQEITPAVNEALACEIPVVAMKCGGSNFVIPNREYGLITKRFDYDDMSNKIEYLIKNEQQSKNIAKKGRLYIIKNFSIQNVAEKVYNALIK